MSVLTTTLSADRGFSGFIRRHPLVSYSVLHSSGNAAVKLTSELIPQYVVLSDNSARPFYLTVLLTWVIAFT